MLLTPPGSATAIRVKLTTKRKTTALKAVREAALPACEIYEAWGLLKDARDTFASHLLTAGVQLGYVSSQLGHSDVSVTGELVAASRLDLR